MLTSIFIARLLLYRVQYCYDYSVRLSVCLKLFGVCCTFGIGTLILGEGEVVGVSDGTIRESDGGFL